MEIKVTADGMVDGQVLLQGGRGSAGTSNQRIFTPSSPPHQILFRLPRPSRGIIVIIALPPPTPWGVLGRVPVMPLLQIFADFWHFLQIFGHFWVF